MANLNLYLDHNSTTSYSVGVVKYIKEELIDDFANASSEHDAGFYLSGKIKEHRLVIADHLGSSTKKIIFTSGATESINTILSIENLKKLNIKSLISSPMEHHATLHQLDFLKTNGFEVFYVKNNSNGELDLSHLAELSVAHPDSMLSFLYVNNETGVINDVNEITAIAHRNRSYVHIDAVQALGKLQFNLDDIDCDFASFSGHKIGSLKGIGLLYVRNIDSFKALLHGGGQERGYRPGTYNYPGIKSFALAVQDIDFKKVEEIEFYRNRLEQEFLKLDSKFKINCQSANRVANTTNLYLGGLDAREVLLNLSRLGVYVSTGSACNGANPEPSHVLKAIRDTDSIDSLRISAPFTETIAASFLKSLTTVLVK